MSEVTIATLGANTYSVQLPDRGTTMSFIVTVPDELLDDLQIGDDQRERLIRESFAFLLEREQPDSILRQFALTDIERFFPDYRDQLRRRLHA